MYPEFSYYVFPLIAFVCLWLLAILMERSARLSSSYFTLQVLAMFLWDEADMWKLLPVQHWRAVVSERRACFKEWDLSWRVIRALLVRLDGWFFILPWMMYQWDKIWRDQTSWAHGKIWVGIIDRVIVEKCGLCRRSGSRRSAIVLKYLFWSTFW